MHSKLIWNCELLWFSGDNSWHAKTTTRFPYQFRSNTPANIDRQWFGHFRKWENRKAYHEKYPRRIQFVCPGKLRFDFSFDSLLNEFDFSLAQDKEVATLIENVYSKLKLMLLNKEENKNSSLLGHLKKINDHLAARATRFLTGDTICCFDCELMPRLQHIRVAGKYFVNFEIPVSDQSPQLLAVAVVVNGFFFAFFPPLCRHI